MFTLNIVFKDSFAEVDEPTHVIKCSGSKEFAFVFSTKTMQAAKQSWMKQGEDDDELAIDAVNNKLPPLPEATECFTSKLKRQLQEFYLIDDKIVSFDQKMVFKNPDAVFFQRVSPRLKTFDMITFWGTKSESFDMVFSHVSYAS